MTSHNTTRRSLFGGAFAIPVAAALGGSARLPDNKAAQIQHHAKALLALIRPGAPEGATRLVLTLRDELGSGAPIFLHAVAVRTALETPPGWPRGFMVDRDLGHWTSSRRPGDFERAQ